LALWNATHFGSEDAQAQFWWRVEPDVLYSGSWQGLLDGLAMQPPFDLVLPRLHSAAEEANALRVAPPYPHWCAPWHPAPAPSHSRTSHARIACCAGGGRLEHEALLQGLPPNRRLWSLVSVSRLSRTFVQHLTTEWWRKGRVGYEEVLLPTACVRAGQRCTLASFATTGAGVGLPILRLGTRHHVVGRHFRFRPEYACHEFKNALQNETHELWHPVKTRECLVSDPLYQAVQLG